MPGWLVIVGAFIPLVTSIIGGIFLVLNSRQRSPGARIQELLELTEKLPRRLDRRYVIERAILREISALDWRAHPLYLPYRYASLFVVVVWPFVAWASLFPSTLNVPASLRAVFPLLSVALPAIWVVALTLITFGSCSNDERYFFERAAQYDLDLLTDRELARVATRLSKFNDSRRQTQYYFLIAELHGMTRRQRKRRASLLSRMYSRGIERRRKEIGGPFRSQVTGERVADPHSPRRRFKCSN